MTTGDPKQVPQAVRLRSRFTRWVVLVALAVGLSVVVAWLGTSDSVQRWLLDRKSTPDLERMVRQDPGSPWPAYVLGMRYARQGRLPEALALFKRARDLAPNSYEAHFALGKAYYFTGAADPAVVELKQAAQLAPNAVGVDRYLGMAQRKAGDLAGAEASEKRATALDPNDAEAWYQLGALLTLSTGDEDKSRPCFQRAVALMPTNGVYRFAYGRTLTDAGDFTEAVIQLREAARRLPNDATTHFLLGLSLHRSDTGGGNRAEALSELQRAIALDPNVFKPHYERGLILEESHDYAGACREFEATCRSSPAFAEGWFHLSRAADHMGRKAEAEAARARFTAIRKDNVDLEALVRHLDKHPDDIDAHLRAGAIMERWQRWNAAAAQYVAVLQGHPDNKPARLALAGLQKRTRQASANPPGNKQP